MPYLNRALAEEQLGVQSAAASQPEQAQQHYEAAIRVRFPGICLSASAADQASLHDGTDILLCLQDCRAAQSRDAKEFAAYFNEGNVQVYFVGSHQPAEHVN